MDVVLSVADQLFLDRFWAWAVPALPKSLPIDLPDTNLDLGVSKPAAPTSSAISNLTAHLANAWHGSRSSAVASEANWEALQGVSAWGRDHFLR